MALPYSMRRLPITPRSLSGSPIPELRTSHCPALPLPPPAQSRFRFRFRGLGLEFYGEAGGCAGAGVLSAGNDFKSGHTRLG